MHYRSRIRVWSSYPRRVLLRVVVHPPSNRSNPFSRSISWPVSLASSPWYRPAPFWRHFLTLMRGQPPKVLAELMGHEDIAVTNRYMHLTPGAKEKAIRALEARATQRLAAVLRRIRHLGSDAVLVQDGGRPVTTKALRGWLKRAQRRAQLAPTGNLYTLRHTFCSHVSGSSGSPRPSSACRRHPARTAARCGGGSRRGSRRSGGGRRFRRGGARRLRRGAPWRGHGRRGRRPRRRAGRTPRSRRRRAASTGP